MVRIECPQYFGINGNGNSFSQVVNSDEACQEYLDFHNKLNKELMGCVNELSKSNRVVYGIDTCELIDKVAHLKKNLCVIGTNYINLFLSDNKTINSNVSSFMSSKRSIVLSLGRTKSSRNKFE